MNINALKALYVALGGNLTNTYTDIADGIAVADYVLLADVISAIAKIAGSSSGSLPAVTSADNGDLLAVVNGAWAKADNIIPDPNDTTYRTGKEYTMLFVNKDLETDENFLAYMSNYALPLIHDDDEGKMLVVSGENNKAYEYRNMPVVSVYFEGTMDTDNHFTACTSVLGEPTPSDIVDMLLTHEGTTIEIEPTRTVVFANILLKDGADVVGIKTYPISAIVDNGNFTLTIEGTNVTGTTSDDSWTCGA